jgi:hypothetical protein
METSRKSFLCVVLALVFCASCAGRQSEDKSHFGTSANFPVFESADEFSGDLRRCLDIIYKHELDGKPVDMEWMDPAFREKLCLVVTINNHCGGG